MNLQKIRTSRNVEQAELAKQIGTTAPMMSCFEHYKCLPVPEMLTQICNILKCNISDLYEDKEIYLKTVTNGCSHLKVEERKEPATYKLKILFGIVYCVLRNNLQRQQKKTTKT